MSRSARAKNRTRSAPSRTPSRRPPTDAAPVADEARELLHAELAHLPDPNEEGSPAEPGPVEGPVDEARLRAAVADAVRAADLAGRRQRRIDEQLDRLDADRRSVEEAQRRLTEDTARLDADRAALAEQRQAVAARQQELLVARQEAASGFAEFRDAQLTLLEEELAKRRADTERTLSDRRAAVEAELGRRQADVDAERRRLDDRLGAERDRQEAERDQLERDRRELERGERRLTARQSHLEQEIADRLGDAEARQVSEHDAATRQVELWRQRYDTSTSELERLQRELAAREETDLRFGHRPLSEVAAELEALRDRNARLASELAGRPADAEDRLRELAAQCLDLTRERADLVRRNEELSRYLAASRIGVTERETAQLVNSALHAQNEALGREVDRIRTTLTELTQRQEHASPFPECSAMDTDETLREAPRLPSGVPDLRALVVRIRHLLAAERLYYSERDVRCFLAGLATSRLHLLQGISGIGKTSLPRAFAQVIGAECAVVPVAAEWRSPQDLAGYYNPFERRFYETEFTQAVYRAQTPRYADRPYFVVLDEMNLAQPEYYFSDMLSELERWPNYATPGRSRHPDAGEPALTLMTARVDPSPNLLRDGRRLALPRNVWFIGTANQDETTVGFADKTYDRAHLLELPPPSAFEAEPAQPLTPVSASGLTRAFTNAAQEHAGDAQTVISFLETELGKTLREDAQLGWGSRLDRHAEAFVPVVRAAGGSLSEAADHLLATKLLRKLAGRLEVVPARLDAIRDAIFDAWPTLDPEDVPERCDAFLTRQIRALGGR